MMKDELEVKLELERVKSDMWMKGIKCRALRNVDVEEALTSGKAEQMHMLMTGVSVVH